MNIFQFDWKKKHADQAWRAFAIGFGAFIVLCIILFHFGLLIFAIPAFIIKITLIYLYNLNFHALKKKDFKKLFIHNPLKYSVTIFAYMGVVIIGAHVIGKMYFPQYLLLVEQWHATIFVILPSLFFTLLVVAITTSSIFFVLNQISKS